MNERIDQIQSDATLVFERYANYIKHVQNEFSSLDERLRELRLHSKHSWREKIEQIPQIFLYAVDYVSAQLEREPLQRLLLVTLKQIAKGLTGQLPRHGEQIRYLYNDIKTFVQENEPKQPWYSKYKGYLFIAAICVTFYWILPVAQRKEVIDLVLGYQDSWKSFLEGLGRSEQIHITMIEFAFAASLWSLMLIAPYLLFRVSVERKRRTVVRFAQELPTNWNPSSLYIFYRQKPMQLRFSESKPTDVELAQARLWRNLEVKPEVRREHITEFRANLIPPIVMLFIILVIEAFALRLVVIRPQIFGSIWLAFLLGLLCIGLLLWEVKIALKTQKEWQTVFEAETFWLEEGLDSQVELDEKQISEIDSNIEEASMEIIDGLPVVHTRVDTDLVDAIRSMREE
ncbi:hypothetical protein [Gloeobacter violaceus]|uniref:Glr0112 protein n=1 Tax=Gloeobacter violaceus (strain ATCC 29082 / PCC 7421) TaxID=251221 RepID=Q7NPE3_GLOVI|nr:hypothetical protein [Gloeobacter violaceus]BAC88053.1 glr0112 [Gloeobacter violaceus PCC 7421]